MYIPKHFAENRPEVLCALIREYPLSTLVVTGENGINANHIPLYLVEAMDESSPYPTLQGHISKANPLWQEVLSQPKNTKECLAIFHGPHAYITPQWYPTKKSEGKAVPTWNYITVHASGFINVHEDALWLRRHLDQLTHHNETQLGQKHQAVCPNENAMQAWTINDAPESYIEGMMKGIVGIEIGITQWVGKWKVSQNQPAINQQGVESALQSLGSPMAQHIGKK